MRDLDRILGSLIAGAAGDALGYAVEFSAEAGIFNTYGRQGITHYCLNTGGKAEISDDTQMTLFTAAGLLNAGDSSDREVLTAHIREAYLDWLGTQRPSRKRKQPVTELADIPALNVQRAPGLTCLSALEAGGQFTVHRQANESKGCGGVMRVAPIGLYIDPTEMTIEDMDRLGADAAAITHGHPLGFLPAAGLVHIIARVLSDPGLTLLEAVEDMIRTVPTLYGEEFQGYHEYFVKLMKRAVKLSGAASGRDMSSKGGTPSGESAVSGAPARVRDIDADLEAIHALGEGWVGEEALAIAIFCALKYSDDLEAALCASVNHKGDSDSTGAITGNILGAYLGYQKLPARFTEDLELTDVLTRYAEALARR